MIVIAFITLERSETLANRVDLRVTFRVRLTTRLDLMRKASSPRDVT